MSLAGKRKDREPSIAPPEIWSEPSAAPPEIWSAILERLDARSLARARLVCREWRALATPLVRAARVRECLIVPIATLRDCGSRVFSIASWAGMFVTAHLDHLLRLWSPSGVLLSAVNCSAREKTIGLGGGAWDAFGCGDVLVVTVFRRTDNEIQIWKESRRAGPTLRSRHVAIERVRILPRRNGRRDGVAPWDDRLVVAFGSDDNYDIETWDENGTTLSRMVGHEHEINDMVAMGERLASASADSTVRIWNKAGACVSILRVPENDLNVGPIRVLTWGERLAVAYDDDTVRIWSDATEYTDLRVRTWGGCMYVWNGTLVTGENCSTECAWDDNRYTARAWDDLGVEKPIRFLRVSMLSRRSHGLLATPGDDHEVRVWGVPE